MLAYILALAVGLGSLGLYMSAFFLPEVHRKNDIIWSGVGLFYALVLWVCANRISGGVLLGQIASVSLLGWLGWQTLMLRREALPKEQQTPLPTSAEIQQLVQQQIEKFTKGQKPANSTNPSASGGSSAFTGLQQGVIGTLDKFTATVEQTIAKFKKTQTPSAKAPKAAVKTPSDTASAPKVATPPTTPEKKVETPTTPVDTASAPKVATPPTTSEKKVETPATPVDTASAPKVATPPTTSEKKVETPTTPVDTASAPDIETPSVADTLPTSDTDFKSPTDEQVEDAIKQAEAEIDNPNSTPESDIPRNSDPA
jgi:hypothetical protein